MKVWKFGDNVDTDQIIPSQYLVLPSMKEMAQHTLEPLAPQFAQQYKAGELLVGGHNFGCGSSREQAPTVLKELGVKVIIAQSFARIFFRNCINLGVLLIELPKANELEQGHEVKIDYTHAKIINKTTKKEYEMVPMSDFFKKIVNSGGLVDYLKNKK
jgi:3-isopropylmalate/(R)-2-methylmalate dehydratase small subunit